jgi:RNA polymerase sigma factor (sigma-70 family)
MPDVSSTVEVISALDPLALDPVRPGVRAQLGLRTAHGGYVIPDALLVRAIRAFHARGQLDRCHALFGVLVERCTPMFRRMAAGLRHRPEWMDEAIADMMMQLWKEVVDPKEIFIEQNFGVYLKRLGADQFKHKLRTEGRIFRTNDKGEVTGRPEHVPATLIDSLDRAPGADDEATPSADGIADADDAIEARLGEIEAERILHFVRDPLDRQIVLLRVFYHQKWDEIAQQCGMSERTMRTRYEIARAQMAAGLGGLPAPPDEAEPAATARSVKKPTRGRKARKD